MKQRTNRADRFVKWYSIFAIVLEMLFQGCSSLNGLQIGNATVSPQSYKWTVISGSYTNSFELTQREAEMFEMFIGL